MKVLNEITLRNIKMNKKRTAVIVIGVILSTALICGVAGIVTSFWNSMIEYTKMNNGDYHTTFYNVPKDEIKNIENNKNVEKIYVSEELGYSYLKGSENEYKPYLSIVSMNDDYLDNMGISLKEGRFPENNNEIVISSHIKENGGVNYKIGDELTLDILDRLTTDGKKLDQNDSFEEYSTETLKPKYTKTFKIVGIVYRPNYCIEDYEAPGYTVITKMTEIKDNANVSVLYKNIKNMEKTLIEITGMEPVENNKVYYGELINYSGFEKNYANSKYKIMFNKSLLAYEGDNLNDSTRDMIMNIAGVVIFIILVSSVFVIRNGFAISVTERFKIYGMLASVGTTKKQLKKTVYFEGIIIAIIGIPIGIISGIFSIWILLKIVNYILADLLNGFSFTYKISVLAILVSVVISLLTIFLSCVSSARRASKICPMDLIRSTNDIKLKPKKLKSPKIIKKIFGIGGDIAYKNLKRSKKKYRTTVISIVVSIVVFIVTSSFIEYGFNLGSLYYKKQDYNISVLSYASASNNEAEKVYKQIVKLDNVEEFSINKIDYLQISESEYLSDFAKKVYKNYKISMEEANLFPIEILAVGEKAYKSYLKELGLKYEDTKDKAILYDTYILHDEKTGKKEEGKLYNLKAGNTVKGKINDNDVEINIIKNTKKLPFSMSRYLGESFSGILIVSDEFIKNIGFEGHSNLYINSNNANELEKDIKAMLEEEELDGAISINNEEREAKQMNAMVLVISIFLYGFIAVITLIGVTNIFNTITTNMKLRSKEFANLKSIGMTKKEFNRMVQLESIFYGLKSLIIGIPIGLVLSYILYKAFSVGYIMDFVLPWMAMLVAILFVLIVIGIIMKYSLNKINKQNIIETIRDENL